MTDAMVAAQRALLSVFNEAEANSGVKRKIDRQELPTTVESSQLTETLTTTEAD